MNYDDFCKEIIERLTRIETKQDNICIEVQKLENRLTIVEMKTNEHSNIIKLISKGSGWWLQVIGSGIGVLLGALFVSLFKGCV